MTEIQMYVMSPLVLHTFPQSSAMGYLVMHIRVFTARRYASVVYAVVVYPSHAGILPKRLNIGSCKQRHTIAQGL